MLSYQLLSSRSGLHPKGLFVAPQALVLLIGGHYLLDGLLRRRLVVGIVHILIVMVGVGLRLCFGHGF